MGSWWIWKKGNLNIFIYLLSEKCNSDLSPFTNYVLHFSSLFDHRCRLGGPRGSDPPPETPLPPPLENFRAGYPLETPSRGSRGSVGGKLTPPPKKKSRQLLYFWSN
jgi:hypothetical protein